MWGPQRMIISCPECGTRFNIDLSVLGAKGKKVRCRNCSHVWFQPGPEAEEAAPAPAPAQTPSATPKPSVPAQEAAPSATHSAKNDLDGDLEFGTDFAGEAPAVPDLAKSDEDEEDDNEKSDDGSGKKSPSSGAGPRELARDYMAHHRLRKGQQAQEAGDEDQTSQPHRSRPDTESQPESHDEEDGDEDEDYENGDYEDGDDQDEEGWPPRRRAATTAWAFLAVFLILFVLFGSAGSVYYFWGWLSQNIPGAQYVATFIGLGDQNKIEGSESFGLLDTNTQRDTVMRDGKEVQIIRISGKVVNFDDDSVEIPKLRATLIDASGTELRSWTFYADIPVLLPDEESSFQTSTEDPPEDASDVQISFVND